MNAVAIEVPNCPQCGGPMQDNRNDPGRPEKAPEFRCYDKSCKNEKGYVTGVYLKDLLKKQNGHATAPKPAARTPQPTEIGGPLPYEVEQERAALAAGGATPLALKPELVTLYKQCFATAQSIAVAQKVDALNGDVAGAVTAMAATLFIASKGK